jgi:hypothetical protein
MRRWGGLPTTGPAAPPSSPGRHSRGTPPAERRSRRPSRPGARAGCGAGYPRSGAPGPAAPRAGQPAAAGAGRDPGGRCASAPATSPGSSPATAPGEHIAFAIGAGPIAPLRRCRTAPPRPPCRITGQAGARRMRRCCSAGEGLLTGCCGEPTVALGRRAGPVLLIVMYEAQTWRVRPGEPFTFGRSPQCSA